MFPGNNCALASSDALCCPTAKSSGMSASPSSPHSSWGSCALCRTNPPKGFLRVLGNMRTNGSAALPPSTRMSPVIIAPQEMRSDALAPSMDVTVALGSSSVRPCRACAMHPHPARVDNAHLVRRGGRHHSVPQPLGHRPRTQSPKHVAHDNASHTSVRFRQGCHPDRLDDLYHRLRNQTSRENFPLKSTCIDQLANRPTEDANAHSSCQKGQLAAPLLED